MAQPLKEYLGDEKALYAQTKQVNQFFRRFNGEEDLQGNRYYEGNAQYRDARLRTGYLQMLFNEADTQTPASRRTAFMRDVVDKGRFLDFHGDEWFAEVEATFTYKGKEEKALLFLRLEPAGQGYQWAFSRAYFAPYNRAFPRDTVHHERFLHPLSHELEFMNLRKAFAERDQVARYAERDFRPDHLTLLLYELRNGQLTFRTVREVRFHFFQVDGWYFRVERFNRAGYNAGWLMTNLLAVTPQEKAQLLPFIYHAQ